MSRPVRNSAVNARAVLAAAEALSRGPLPSGRSSSLSRQATILVEDGNNDDDEGVSVSSSSPDSSTDVEMVVETNKRVRTKNWSTGNKPNRRATGPASSKVLKRSRESGSSMEDTGGISSEIGSRAESQNNEDVSGGSEEEAGSSDSSSSGGETSGDEDEREDNNKRRSRHSVVSKSSHKQRHYKGSTTSSINGGKRRTNPYFVLEHSLEKPPRRKTRPVDEGETIGDALFFGDDLMFGLTQGDKSRLKNPWPERLRSRLVNDAGLRLVMLGLPGRTSRWDDAVLAERLSSTGAGSGVNSEPWCKPQDFNGLFQFGTVFSSHSPALLVIALGTNDIKAHIREEAVKAMSSPAFTFRLNLSPSELDELRWQEREDGRNARMMMHQEVSSSSSPQQVEEGKDNAVAMNGEENNKGHEGVSINKQVNENSSEAEDLEEEDEVVEFTADTVAEAVGSIALKAQLLFKGHCHEGYLRTIVVVPPSINFTPFASKQGFDNESVTLSKEFPEAFERMVQRFGSDIRLVSLPSFRSHNWSDGIHPNDQAAGELSEAVWAVIAENLKRRPKPTSFS